MWIVFALATPFFFALVHILDSFCVEDIFEKPWMGMVTGAFASLVIYLPLPYILPFVSWNTPSIHIIGMAVLAGSLIQISQLFYFKALSYSEAGIVAAYWNMVPALVPIASFFFLREILHVNQYIGIAVLIVASVGFYLIDSNLNFRKKSFFLMFAAALMQAFMFLLQGIVYSAIPYIQGFYLITTGLIITGFLPLLHPNYFALFKKNIRKLYKVRKLFFSIEIVNLMALASSQRAVDLGVPSLVAGVETTTPAYIFFLSIVFLHLKPKLINPKSTKKIFKKLLLVGIMSFGVILIA